MYRLSVMIRNLMKQFALYGYRLFIRMFRVDRQILLFESNLGRNYTGNPKAIYEEMVKQGLDKRYRCYFIVENMRITIPGQAKKVRKNNLGYFYLFAVAGIWVSDSRLPKYIIKRPECYYIQTWHGTPLKKLAMDMDSVSMSGETSVEDYKKNFIDNTRTWDCLISQNSFSTRIFRRAFDFHKEILETGYPRNDVLFKKNNPEDIKTLREKLGLPIDKRILLYAPTWRDNEFYGIGRYKFNPRIDFSMLQNELSHDTVVIVKYHYLASMREDWSTYGDFIRSYDSGQDIASLYLVSDMLITDYSSAMFDYSILHRPMLFYCYDLDEFRDTLRGFYFDFLKEAPGPVMKTTEELITAILTYDASEYHDRYEAFCRKYNHADDGTASQKIVQLIKDTAQQ